MCSPGMTRSRGGDRAVDLAHPPADRDERRPASPARCCARPAWSSSRSGATPARCPCRGLQTATGAGAAAAGRARAAGSLTAKRRALGDRHQRPHGERRADRRSSVSMPRRCPSSPATGAPRQARPRPVPAATARLGVDWSSTWSATASGTCSRHAAPARSASGCCRAATARRAGTRRRLPGVRRPEGPAETLG